MRTVQFRSFAAKALAAVALTVGVAAVPVLAQGTKADVEIGKKGEVDFNVPVNAGGTLLKAGMYQLQHAVEGGAHFIAFHEVVMPAGYRHGSTQVKKEAAARIACAVEPLDKNVSKADASLRVNAAGEKEVADVRIAGETVKHVL